MSAQGFQVLEGLFRLLVRLRESVRYSGTLRRSGEQKDVEMSRSRECVPRS